MHSKWWIAKLSILLIAGASIGCSDSEATAPADLVMRDSAGVRIVEIPAEAFEQIPRLTVDSTPVLSIGVVEGEEPYMLAGARFPGTVSGDTLVVVNGQTRSLRFYGADGTFLHEVGRSGEGPGEYEFIAGLSRLPDGSLNVWDARQRRMTQLESDGELRDTWTLPVRGVNESWVGALADGSLLLRGALYTNVSREANQSFLIRAWPGGDRVDTLVSRPRNVREIMRFGSPSWEEPVFEPRVSYAVDSASIWLAPGGSWEVRRLTDDARPLEILRPMMARRTISQAEFEHWADSMAFEGPWPLDERPEIRRIYDRLGRGDSLPSVQDVRIGTEGRIWLREYPFPGVVGDRRWLVLERTGAPVAWVILPTDFTPWEFGSEQLLGVRRDELGVQYIERRALIPAGG